MDIGGWALTAPCGLSMREAIDLVGVISAVTTVAYEMIAVHLCVFEHDGGDKPGDFKAMAANIASFRSAIEQASDELHKSSTTPLAEKPLRFTIAHMSQWLKVTQIFETHVSDFVLGLYAKIVSDSSASIDSDCPRWGDSINDRDFKDDSARVQLLLNPRMQELPAAIRNLQEKALVLVEVCAALTGRTPENVEACSTAARAANNSLRFAKRTVSVAAATKAVLAATPNPKLLQTVLQIKGTLPAALVARLEAALKAASTSEAPGAEAADAARLAAGASSSSTAGSEIAASSSTKRGGGLLKRAKSSRSLQALCEGDEPLPKLQKR